MLIDLIAKKKIHHVELITVLNNAPVNCFVIKKLPPPKKKITDKLDINKILAYSPRKKAANIIAEYSTLYPATNSASASGKSKGALFVSAKIEIKKTIAIGNKGKINQIVSFCIWVIVFKFNELLNKIIGSKIKLIDISYEIICETDLNAPIRAYLELLDQPANKIP
jgi:hypothetical protein